MEPLTIQMTDEQVKRKQEQQKAKAPPPGTSRILSRANREHKKIQSKPQPILHQPKLPQQDNSIPPKPILTQVNNMIEQSTNKNSPHIAIEAKVDSKSIIKNTNTVNENQIDIEEWQSLAEELNPGKLG